MQIAIIVAVDETGLIGDGARIPWLGHLPADMKRFRELTMGHPIIMGRKTYETIGRALPGRTLIVLSRQTLSLPSGVLLAHTREDALALAARTTGSDMIFIGGGAKIYREFLPSATRIFLTEVAERFVGDTYFPSLEPNTWGAWKIEAETHHDKDALNRYPYTFVTLTREAG